MMYFKLIIASLVGKWIDERRMLLNAHKIELLPVSLVLFP